MKKNWLLVSTGFALFSMFFGSGNLVFPIAVGRESDGHTLFATIGILITGVLVPFLGVLGMILFKGSIPDFFAPLGKKGTFWFSLFALAIMGPFGVLARCLTVAHGALELLFPTLSLPVASFLLCALIFVLTVNKSKIVSILGSLLTPVLLAAIAAIAYFGLRQDSPEQAPTLMAFTAFKNGFFQGYQTMDLLAAFFFSTFIIKFLEETSDKSPHISPLKLFLKASMIGAVLLSAVYAILVALGWKYSALLSETAPQEMLGKIAMEH